MRRIGYSIVVLLILTGLIGYAGGFFTGEVRQEESCLLCRATRYTGSHYGFSYERIEDSALTRWYRRAIDPQHGLEPGHPHHWATSACTVTVMPGNGQMDYTCGYVSPIFLLRPEIQLDVLQRIPDAATQVSLLHSLNAPSRKLSTRRIRLLIEYYYVDREDMPWERWWQLHARDFGMEPPTLPDRMPSSHASLP